MPEISGHFSEILVRLHWGFRPSSTTEFQPPAHAAPDPCERGCSIAGGFPITLEKRLLSVNRTPSGTPLRTHVLQIPPLFPAKTDTRPAFSTSEKTAFPAACLAESTTFPDDTPSPSSPANKTNPRERLSGCGIDWNSTANRDPMHYRPAAAPAVC